VFNDDADVAMAAFHGDWSTIETFRAFIADRHDWEKWELIEGQIIETHSSTLRHQLLVARLLFEIETAKRAANSRWLCIPGICIRVPGDIHNEITPDAMILPRSDKVFGWTYDVLAAFEVTAPETTVRDLDQKLAFYRRIEKLTHYIVLAQDRREATVFTRSNSFEPQILKSEKAKIEIEPLGVSVQLADIYRGVLLG
jgi:Uma2 family endonuclease